MYPVSGITKKTVLRIVENRVFTNSAWRYGRLSTFLLRLRISEAFPGKFAEKYFNVINGQTGRGGHFAVTEDPDQRRPLSDTISTVPITANTAPA